MPKPRDIFCISTSYWCGEWFRKQQFMARFAADGHRVLYVEPSHSLVRRFDDREYITNALLSPGLKQVSDTLWVLTPRVLLPGVSRPFVSRINARRQAADVRRALEKLGFRDTLAWVYAPELQPGLGVVPHSALVADLVDDLVAYEVREDRKRYVRNCIDALMAEANVAICTTPGLAETFRPDALVVPNGYDASVFDPSTPPASELKGYAKIVGFVGTLFRYLDYDLIAAVATSIPEATVVLVGRKADDSGGLERALALPNVVHVPPVPRERVPEFIAAFDVCMVPFKVDEVSRNVSPLKAYEYLAMGKPVVSAEMPSLAADPAARGVCFAASAEQFVASVRARIDADAEQPHQVDAAIAQASWDGRYRAVRAAAADVLESGAR